MSDKHINFYSDPYYPTPSRANLTDAGIDLYATEDKIIWFWQTAKIATNTGFQLPENHVGLVLERSSMALKGYRVAGGVIDFSYTKPISVLMSVHGALFRRIKSGQKIAQLVILPVNLLPLISSKSDLIDVSDRGGFGSTGQ